MEHRIARRIPATLDVLLSCGGRDLGWFQTRELSRDGFSLCGQVPSLRTNSLVSVLLHAGVDVEAVQVERRAVVVHCQKGRLGLMWAELEGGAHSIIRNRPLSIAVTAN